MMESRRRLQNGVRPRARRLPSQLVESEVDGCRRPSDLRSLLGGDVEWMTYGQDGNRLQQVRYTDGRTAARCVLRDSVHSLGGIF